MTGRAACGLDVGANTPCIKLPKKRCETRTPQHTRSQGLEPRPFQHLGCLRVLVAGSLRTFNRLRSIHGIYGIADNNRLVSLFNLAVSPC